MNRYTYDEISIGQTESFSVTITNEMMDSFCAMTGDINPLHADAEYAKKAGEGSQFAGRVVYGMLTASFLSTLAGVYLPGEHSLIHRTEAEFPAPVYVGDTLLVSGEVAGKNDDFRFIELKVSARNGAGKKVMRGKMRVGVLK